VETCTVQFSSLVIATFRVQWNAVFETVGVNSCFPGVPGLSIPLSCLLPLKQEENLWR